MNPATLLFDTQYGKIRLFGSRLELAKELLFNPESLYSLEEPEDSVAIMRELNTLQSYLSHLLSGTGKRKLTEKFKESLYTVIANKLIGEDVDARKITNAIIDGIEKINSLSQGPKNSIEKETSIYDDFITDLNAARYIVVFTSRPIELEAHPNEQLLKIRTITIDAILNYFLQHTHTQKFRYNFPNQIIGVLFWRKVCYLIMKRLIEEIDLKDRLYEFLKRDELNMDILPPTLDSFKKEKGIKPYVDRFLQICNNRALVQVFYLKEPVFVIPHIVINPNEFNSSSGYLYLGTKNSEIQLHKYSSYSLGVWREKVWDLIKANRNSNSISYTESIEPHDDDFILNLV